MMSKEIDEPQVCDLHTSHPQPSRIFFIKQVRFFLLRTNTSCSLYFILTDLI